MSYQAVAELSCQRNGSPERQSAVKNCRQLASQCHPGLARARPPGDRLRPLLELGRTIDPRQDHDGCFIQQRAGESIAAP